MSLMETRQRNTRPRLGLWIPMLAIFVCACVAASLAVASTLLSEEEPEAVETEIVYGLTLSPSGIDPHINASSELGIPLYSVYDTLIYRHPQTFEFVGGLAENWTVSADGRVYTFNLKSNVKFHDGTDFDANAVGVTLDRIVDTTDAQTASQKARFMLGPYYEGYVIINPLTIEIRLTDPYPALLDALSQPYFGIASPTALANSERSTYQMEQVGTGPYKMVNYIPDDRIVLERNPDYDWGPVFYADVAEKPAIERITFLFFEDPETRRLALEAGDVDIIGEIPPHDAEILRGNQEFSFVSQPLPGQPLQFLFNTTNAPTADLNLRKALLYVTNRETIVETVFRRDLSPVAYGPMSASTPFYDPAMTSFYKYDPQQAETFFGAAGYTDSDEDGMLDKNGEPLKIKMVIAGWGFLPDVATLMQSQWREIGVELEIEQVPGYGALLDKANSGDFDLLAINSFGTDPVFLNSYYLSEGVNNYGGFQDTELDGWLLQASQANDTVQRNEFYRLVQNRIMEQALILPIRDYTSVVGWSKNLDGVIFAPQGWWPLLNNFEYNGN